MNGRHHFFDDRSHGVGMQKVPPPPFWVLVNCGRSYTQGNKERQFLFFSPYI